MPLEWQPMPLLAFESGPLLAFAYGPLLAIAIGSLLAIAIGPSRVSPNLKDLVEDLYIEVIIYIAAT